MQRLSLRKYLVLASIAVSGALGDICLERGMNDIGSLSLSNAGSLISAIFTPWVAIGIVLLLGFFAAYSIALSWADLTFVLPATALGYVLIALLAQFVLHQDVSLTRWIGILLVSVGVGVVAGGPPLTAAKEQSLHSLTRAEGSNG